MKTWHSQINNFLKSVLFLPLPPGRQIHPVPELRTGSGAVTQHGMGIMNILFDLQQIGHFFQGMILKIFGKLLGELFFKAFDDFFFFRDAADGALPVAFDDFGNPVGTVYIGYCDGNKSFGKKYFFSGDREAVRQKTILAALELVLQGNG